MNVNDLRRRYVEFFVKNFNHKKILGASLIPENDPTVLFTTAGMHPLVPFLKGEAHPSGKRLVSVQRCIRTQDIDEVGDSTHLTMFEMMGNWSLGDYFKELAIEMSYKFLTTSIEDGGLGFSAENICVTCFEGDKDAPRDDEAAGIWKGFGFVEGEALKIASGNRIYFYGKKENWWGPAGQTGPCGPDSEMYIVTDKKPCAKCAEAGPACSCNRCIEIWNDVFMQYNKNEDGSFTELEQKNIDTGMGLERTLCIMNGLSSPYETELFTDIINEIRLLGSYDKPNEDQSHCERIIADHLRAATFILGDECGVSPSNTDQGYVLRRIIRRAISHGFKLGIEVDFTRKIAGIVVKNYGDAYPTLEDKKEIIFEEISREEGQFKKTLFKGMKILEKEMDKFKDNKAQGFKALGENFIFNMTATSGFPVEMTIEELENHGWIRDENEKEEAMKQFEEEYKKHQELSRVGAEQKFKGGLQDHSEITTKYHTATHLLHQALRKVLGNHVEQKGSNITSERLRFDFTHNDNMTNEEIKTVEDMVNEEIEKSSPVVCNEMSVKDAKLRGAIGLFESKYGDTVKVYRIGDENDYFSMEICGGPHVENTKELGHFKIVKEQSSSRGVRRIKAILE